MCQQEHGLFPDPRVLFIIYHQLPEVMHYCQGIVGKQTFWQMIKLRHMQIEDLTKGKPMINSPLKKGKV
jgi:hypothetical protein